MCGLSWASLRWTALRWAAVPAVVAGVIAGNVSLAAAQEPPPAPTPPGPPPTPTAAPTTPDPAPAPLPTSETPTSETPTSETPTGETPTAEEPTPTPPAPGTGTVTYNTTVTTTTTEVNAPITLVAAPITPTSDPGGAPERLVMYLTGCGGSGHRSQAARHERVRDARLRLDRNAILVVRVNGRRVATLRLPSTGHQRARGNALRVRLAPNGMLTIRRPSGRVLAVRGCTPA
jgi:hypothetical protein